MTDATELRAGGGWGAKGTQRQRNKDKIATCTCQVFGQVRVVHEAVARKLHTLEPDWDVNVIEPGGCGGGGE